MATEEEKRLKRQKAVGREVPPEELPIELRLFRLEKIVAEFEQRIRHLEHNDDARGMSGMMIGGSQ